MHRLVLAGLLGPLLLAACRDADDDDGASGAALVPSVVGMHGCAGPDAAFVVGQAPLAVALATLAVGEDSQLAASRTSEVLYATGDGATVVAIDVSGVAPVETELVGAGVVAALLATEGITDPPALLGVAVLDVDTLLVVEGTSNTVLTVDRALPDTVGFFAGQPNVVPGFADGLATGQGGLARFSFSERTQLCPTGAADASVFVADPGNHAVRLITDGFVTTIAGAGTAFFRDGDLPEALFDTPTGVAVSCSSELLVSERGDSGFGNRLRALSIGAPSPFGGFFGAASTLAGDGTRATTEGPSLAGAQLAAPEALFVTSGGETYWVDSSTGVLRRRSADGVCDCPLHADCAAAVLAPDFPAGNRFALAETAAGKLFVLDATAGTLFQVAP